MLCAAVAVLAFDRSVLHALQPNAPWRGRVAGAALAAFSPAPAGIGAPKQGPKRCWRWHCSCRMSLVTALVLSGHLAVAASFLVAGGPCSVPAAPFNGFVAVG